MARRPILTARPKAPPPEEAMEGTPTAVDSPAEETGEQDPSKVADDQPNVTPEEQAEYDQFMNNALKLIYVTDEKGGKVRPEVLEALAKPPEQDQAQGTDPNHGAILALAQAAVTIVSQLDDSARKAGKPISDDVLYHGGAAVIEELAEVASAAKIHDYSEEDITGALAQAVDMYRPKAIQDGRTSEDQLKGQFGEINQAEAQGNLGQVLPGLDQQPQQPQQQEPVQ